MASMRKSVRAALTDAQEDCTHSRRVPVRSSRGELGDWRRTPRGYHLLRGLTGPLRSHRRVRAVAGQRYQIRFWEWFE